MTGLKNGYHKYCLLVYIDDATCRLMHLRSCQSESAFYYLLAAREYIDKHGKPVAIYSDKHAVFRVSQAGHDIPA